MLQADSYADLIATTLRDLGRMKWVDLSADLQEFVVLGRIFNKQRVKFEDGYGTQWNIQTDDNGSAQQTGLYGTVTVDNVDTMRTASLPWRYTTAYYSYDEREMKMNRGASRIVELTKTKRHACMMSLAKHCEAQFFNKPADSTDTEDIYGMPMWNVKNNNATAGFIGGDPSGFTAGYGGIASTAVTRWQNWAGGYTNVSDVDAVTKMRKAATFTNFISPVPAVPGYNRPSSREVYCNYATLAAFETLAAQQNENLGNDIASKDGLAMFRRIPIRWVPYLEADTSNPIYGMDWSQIDICFLADEYLLESPPEKAPFQPRVREVHVDLSWNPRCRNRRSQWVLSV